MLIVEKAEPRLSAERIGAREDADSVATLSSTITRSTARTGKGSTCITFSAVSIS